MELSDFARIAGESNNLAVVVTLRADSTAQASVVNAGVLDHPVSGEPVVACVISPGTKLNNLRRRPQATVVARAGWQWATVEGACDLIGPDDEFSGFDRSGVPELLRSVFRAAGGTHSDWDEYDRVMSAERRLAVLVRPTRIYSNG